jgi:FkbM family methyltransferase
MKDTAVRILKRALGTVGLEVRRRRPPGDELAFLRAIPVRTILDIGANEGQFARVLRRLFPRATIHSFEPVPSAYARLAGAAAKDGRLHAHRLALGESAGEVDVEVNEFTPASSILRPTQALAESFPYAASTHAQTVAMTTLDDWAAGVDLEPELLLKLDVQGYEDRVLRGGKRVLARAAAVIIEVSFTPLYEGQVLFDEVAELLRHEGLRCAGMVNNGCDPRTGGILYADAVFRRA